jgi:hypothetical protein
MVVQAEAILIAGRNTSVMLREKENLFIFYDDGSSYAARDDGSGRIK